MQVYYLAVNDVVITEQGKYHGIWYKGWKQIGNH
jgi:hypothetical protein